MANFDALKKSQELQDKKTTGSDLLSNDKTYLDESGNIVKRPVTGTDYAKIVDAAVAEGEQLKSQLSTSSPNPPKEVGQWMDVKNPDGTRSKKWIIGGNPYQNDANLEFGQTLTNEIENNPDYKKPFNIADQVSKEVGTVGEDGPTAEQASAIAAIQEFNKNFLQQQTDDQNKANVQTDRGAGFTGGASASSILGVDNTTTSTTGGLPSGTPGIYGNALNLAGDVLGTELDMAQANLTAQERLREQQLRSSLGKLSLGDEDENVLSALEGKLGRLSLPQLEQLATMNGLELTQDLKDSLTRSGKSAIERELITKKERLAENQYSKNQLARTFERSLTDREDFNTQQDNQLRRLAASFGGGKFESMGANVAVMKAAEKGQQALEDIQSDYGDKTMLVSAQADYVMETYNNNVGLIQNQMSDALENKYAQITETIDGLLAEGVTNEVELNNAILKAKKDYMNSYFTIGEKAYAAVETENQRLFENNLALRELKLKENEVRQSSYFSDNLGMPISSPTSNSSGVTYKGGGDPYKRDDGSTGFYGENCIKYLRTLVPNLPWGLTTQADKRRAIEEEGFRDPSQLQIGDAVLTAEGDWGHGAQTIGIDGTDIILREANYVSGQITEGRRISMYDPKIYGFISSGMAPGMNIGGNIEKEGAQQGITSYVDEAAAQQAAANEFTPQNRAEQIAMQLAKEEIDAVDLQRMGATENDIAQLYALADQIKPLLTEAPIELEPKEKFQFTNTLKTNFESQVKEPKKAITQINIIRQSFDKAKNDFKEGKSINAVSQGILVSFQKMLDPTSVVRESEYARSGDGQAILQMLFGQYDKLTQGGAGVTEEGLREFVETAELFMSGYEDSIVDAAQPIIASANEFGLDLNSIFSPDVQELIIDRELKSQLSPTALSIAKALEKEENFRLSDALRERGPQATEEFLLSLINE